MSEQPGRAEPGQPPIEQDLDTLDTIADVVQQLTAVADVRTVFGEPQTLGERTIIPAAEVICGLGVGAGRGRGTPTPEGARPGGGSGGGAWGGARVRPIAAIVVELGGVSVEPIVDVTQVWMAVLSAGIFSLFWMGRRLRRGAALEQGALPPPPKALHGLFRRR